MGGINIYGGSFSGDDKSGSAFEGVLAGMESLGSAAEGGTIASIRAALSEAEDHVVIETVDVRRLLPLLRTYAAAVEGQLTVPGDPFDQMARDEQASPGRTTELQYGEGLGWRAWCARDLLRAFETADAESEQVALVW